MDDESGEPMEEVPVKELGGSESGASTMTQTAYSESQWGKKGKVFPYSLPSVGPGADPGVQAVSPQVT